MATAKTHPDNDPFAGEGSSEEEFWYFQCTSPTCGLRFPAPDKAGLVCPVCRFPVEKKNNWKNCCSTELFTYGTSSQLSVILDNLRSAYNVGSILRTADGAGIDHAYLCGITPTPQHPRLAKTSLTAEIHTSWSYHPNGLELVTKLKEMGVSIFGLETNPDAVNLLEKPVHFTGKAALIVGNEIYGIDPEIQAMCDKLFFLPMLGIKKSLNVAVSFGVAAYILNRFTIQKHPVQSGAK
jgi:23S rRNA (guanosine2251-2'-O)-methyltransferase